MSRETKFGYGFLLAGVGLPYLIERSFGPSAALAMAALLLLFGICLLIAGHLHEHKGLAGKIISILVAIIMLVGGIVWRVHVRPGGTSVRTGETTTTNPVHDAAHRADFRIIEEYIYKGTWPIKPNAEVWVTIHVKNDGSAASGSRTYMKFAPAIVTDGAEKPILKEVEMEAAQNPGPEGHGVRSNEEFYSSTRLSPQLTKSQMAGLKNGKLGLYLVGFIKYRDQVGSCITHICYFFSGLDKHFHFCSRSNESECLGLSPGVRHAVKR